MSRKRRRKKLPGVSFFAFQDIITALAGMLLLLVLAIFYENNTTRQTVADSAAAKPLSEYHDLLKVIDLRRSELARERKKLESLQTTLRSGRRSPIEKSQQNRLQQEVVELEKVTARRKLLLKKLQQELEQLRQQNSSLDDSEQRSALTRQIKKHQQELNNRRNLLKLSAAVDKQNLLLDCARSCWRFEKPGTSEMLWNHADISPEKTMEKLYAHLRKYDCSQVRLVVAVRPSAGGFIGALLRKLHKDFPQLEIVPEPLLYENTGGIEL